MYERVLPQRQQPDHTLAFPYPNPGCMTTSHSTAAKGDAVIDHFIVKPLANELADELQRKIDQKTKPPGSLGQIEKLAYKIGLIQGSLSPAINNPALLVFAGDHGIVDAGVSAYPQCVTAQMVINFLSGGAAINVFARQHGLALIIVDAGVNADLPEHPLLLNEKIRKGTDNFIDMPAMSADECNKALASGARLVARQHQNGCNCIGFGEMGIGNTSAAALLVHCLAEFPLEKCIGRGTGLDDDQLQNKKDILELAYQCHAPVSRVEDALRIFGGFEIVMMTGAFIKAAELGMTIIVDGFIASAGLLAAVKKYPAVLDYCIFSHLSSEQGHRALLAYFKAEPLLNMELRLGEGTGVALAYPLLKSSVLFLEEMATFNDAGVSGQTK